jgi:dihydrolipoamide dehydrogenase
MHFIPPAWARDLTFWTPSDAIEIPEIPPRLLVVGGGLRGLELAGIYSGLGSEVTMVELQDAHISHVDQDLLDILLDGCEDRFAGLYEESTVLKVEHVSDEYHVSIRHGQRQLEIATDRLLVMSGLTPNTAELGLERAGIIPIHGGYIQVDESARTQQAHIYAAGDITPGPPMAYRACSQGRVAAETIAKHPAKTTKSAIPSVSYTFPQIAWVGTTEYEAKSLGLEYKSSKFPLDALGKGPLTCNNNGIIKVITDLHTDLVLGVGIVGPRACDVISEPTLAVALGATLEDLMLTIRPYPFLSEATMEAAEIAKDITIHCNPLPLQEDGQS